MKSLRTITAAVATTALVAGAATPAFAGVRGTTDGICKNKPRPNAGSGSGSYPADAPAA